MINLNARRLERVNWPGWTIEATKVWVVRAKRRVYFIALVKTSGGYQKGYGVREMQRDGTWSDLAYGLTSRIHALAVIRADLEEVV